MNSSSTGPDKTVFSSWYDIDSLDVSPAGTDKPVAHYRQFLQRGNNTLIEQFDLGTDIKILIHARSWLVDQVLQRAWSSFMAGMSDKLALVAVGGYGRSELMPGSDVDLLLLLPDTPDERITARIEALLTFLWDIKLEVGHSVRTINDCIEQSLADITVATNLMEARLLAGSSGLFRQMQDSTGPAKIWSSQDFFAAKHREQRERHNKYHNTAYKLEPNIKESPGGLRDIQMIAWVANRHFGTASLEELVERNFLTREEYQTLVDGRDLIWRIRFALHSLSGRGEDRLLFDYQRTLAEKFGFRDDENRLGVEAFMKQYYQTVMELNRLNEMLLQLFHEDILHPEGPGEPVVLNKRFQSRHGFLETSNPHIFRNYPFALLEIFLVLEQNPGLRGVSAVTIRSIRENRHLIDADFRNDIRATSLFMEIIRQPSGVTHELRRMNVYGILAAYLPAFGKIVGLMQYDLFHIYTVDEHILFVVRNLRRFTVPEFSGEFPLCSHIVSTLPKPELLHLAGLFHDIAKGRGGDHSDLGGEDARDFCLRHGLGKYDTNLVKWLVNNHLLMSSTAQREDISDPLVVNHFAKVTKDTVHLDYLYLLTVADIRATNPDMWTTWKDALLKQLYYNTRRALQRGLQDPMERAEHIQKIQDEAARLLENKAGSERVQHVWGQLGDEYFLRHSADQAAHHTRLLANQDEQSCSIVDIRPQSELGSTEIFICARAADELFSVITAVLDQLGLNVVDAGIITTPGGHVLNTFHVLEATGSPVTGTRRIEEIRSTLLAETTAKNRDGWRISRRTPRQYRHFSIKTHIEFKPDKFDRRTVMELITTDRPGLLSHISQAFTDCGVRLMNAKITTLGARAEDVFYITDRNDQPLTEKAQLGCLETAIRRYLDSDSTLSGGGAG